jgi:hypothetical protein
MTTPTPEKRKPSPVLLLALIGGLIGLAQWVTDPAYMARGGLPYELVGGIGGGGIVGALVGWLWLRLRRRSETTRPR